MAPFAIIDILGKPLAYGVYLLIGVAFGAVLEMAGFADSRRLSAQFYLKDMTVLKVMFTGIVTAMVLIFLASGLGLLDYTRVWVNPTYLVPGIVGGLIMGVGFIIGGFCPGTSIVALATLKVDGLFFFLGASLGVFLFGETVGLYPAFFHSTSMGRFTLPQWLGLPTGVVVVAVVLMALFMFWGAEKLEAAFGGGVERQGGSRSRWKLVGAATLVGLALAVLAIGQPSAADRWAHVAGEKQKLLDGRAIHVQPGELVELAQNDQIDLKLLDVRDERDFNLFHLIDAQRVSLDEIRAGLVSLRLLSAPPQTVTVLISNDEARAVEAWKLLVAGGVTNVYVLEGGINHWLDTFHQGACAPGCTAADGTVSAGPDTLRHVFEYARGASHPGADPDALVAHNLAFTPKVVLQTRRTRGGGCG